MLLCSSLTRVYVFDLSKPGIPVQVGKNLRQGAFGVCFEPDSKTTPPALLSSRPGRRIWKAHCGNGSVLATLKFKLPPPRLFSSSHGFSIAYPDSKIPKYSEKSLYYALLHPFQQGVVSYREKGRQLFFLDTTNVNIYEWFFDLPLIYSIVPTEDEVFILHSKDSSITIDESLMISRIKVEPIVDMMQYSLRQDNLNQYELNQAILNALRYSMEDDNLYLILEEKLQSYNKIAITTEQGEEETYEGFDPKIINRFFKIIASIKDVMKQQKLKEEEEKNY